MTEVRSDPEVDQLIVCKASQFPEQVLVGKRQRKIDLVDTVFYAVVFNLIQVADSQMLISIWHFVVMEEAFETVAIRWVGHEKIVKSLSRARHSHDNHVTRFEA